MGILEQEYGKTRIFLPSPDGYSPLGSPLSPLSSDADGDEEESEGGGGWNFGLFEKFLTSHSDFN